MSEHYDMIVGSGAGGALAHTSAPSGKDPTDLYVVDTSFFPSIGAVNPALTAMANAIRVGEHL
ncbi:MAG TPA: GMC oxidoreductase [Streptosporangiaceae bacterium]|nr:GMC oxidoreductase [Streptosporangiaceae bacterium]